MIMCNPARGFIPAEFPSVLLLYLSPPPQALFLTTPLSPLLSPKLANTCFWELILLPTTFYYSALLSLSPPPRKVRDRTGDRGRGGKLGGEGRGLREMEGRVDENNRSLLPNPFVSTVLIHPSEPPVPPTPPSPNPHRSPSLNPCLCTNYPALPPHKQLTAVLKPILVPQTFKQKYTAAAVAPKNKHTTQAQLCPCFHPVRLRGHWGQASLLDHLLLFVYANIF